MSNRPILVGQSITVPEPLKATKKIWSVERADAWPFIAYLRTLPSVQNSKHIISRTPPQKRLIAVRMSVRQPRSKEVEANSIFIGNIAVEMLSTQKDVATWIRARRKSRDLGVFSRVKEADYPYRRWACFYYAGPLNLMLYLRNFQVF